VKKSLTLLGIRGDMTRRGTLVALALLGAVVPTALAPAGQASGETPITTCGQVVRTNAFLTRDLTCAGAGVVVGASGIIINLNGFALHGDRSFGRYGVDDLNGFDRVTVENGVVGNFDDGLVGFGANGLVVSGLVASGNTDGGIFVVGSTPLIQSSRALRNGEDGIYVLGMSATVQSSTASANAGSGIYVSGAFSRVRSSTASDNASDGIVVAGDAARLEHNRTEANGVTASTSNFARLGILVFGYTTAPTGTNVALGNSDPAECRPRSLC
jgi:hypothetical protein